MPLWALVTLVLLQGADPSAPVPGRLVAAKVHTLQKYECYPCAGRGLLPDATKPFGSLLCELCNGAGMAPSWSVPKMSAPAPIPKGP